jgi:hypothetical protein
MYLKNCEIVVCDSHDTPTGKFSNNETRIDLFQISHEVKNLNFGGKTLFADINILETLKGKLLKQIIESGLNYKFWPRGTGIVDENLVISDFKLLAIDVHFNMI